MIPTITQTYSPEEVQAAAQAQIIFTESRSPICREAKVPSTCKGRIRNRRELQSENSGDLQGFPMESGVHVYEETTQCQGKSQIRTLL